MKVVVDTSIWSLALRRNASLQPIPVVDQLRKLITDDRVVLLGAVQQNRTFRDGHHYYGKD